MRKILFITFLLAAVSVNAQTSDSIPSWFENPPVSRKVYYGVGVGTSISIELAEKKAMLQAKLQIAEQSEVGNKKEVKKITKTVNGGNNEEVIQRKVVEAKLIGVKMIKKEVTQKEDTFTVYVMMEMEKKK